MRYRPPMERLEDRRWFNGKRPESFENLPIQLKPAHSEGCCWLSTEQLWLSTRMVSPCGLKFLYGGLAPRVTVLTQKETTKNVASSVTKYYFCQSHFMGQSNHKPAKVPTRGIHRYGLYLWMMNSKVLEHGTLPEISLWPFWGGSIYHTACFQVHTVLDVTVHKIPKISQTVCFLINKMGWE